MYGSFSLFALLVLLFGTVRGIDLYDLCPSVRGINTSLSVSEDNPNIVAKINDRIQAAHDFCNLDEATPQSVKTLVARSACYTVMDEEYGIEQVNVDHYFPMLSYNTKVKLTQRIDPKYLEPSKNVARVAYIILTHTDYDAIIRLLAAIYHDNNVYVIHVDAKEASLKQRLIEHVKGMSNIAVLETSYNIEWGTVEMVYATLESIFALLDVAVFDHVINLSGQDYPVCTQEELGRFLFKKKHVNFDFSYIASELYKQYRLSNVFVPTQTTEQCVLPDVEVRTPAGIAAAWSTSQWFIFNYKFAQSLRKDPFSHRVLAWLEASLIPDESYFGNVLMNTEFGDHRDRNNMRYLSFQEGHIHPDIQTEADFATLTSPKANFCFARKFDSSSTKVLNMIDEHLAKKPQKSFMENHFVPTRL